MITRETTEDPYDEDEPWTAEPTTPEEWQSLIGEWDEIRQGYHLGDTRARVLECARRLRASVAAGGSGTALWTFGLLLTGPYVLYARPNAAAEARVLEAMTTVERALGQASCAHEAHPCDDVTLDDESDNLPAVLEMLTRADQDATPQADPAPAGRRPDEEAAESWFEGRMTREVWACPRNLAGFARSFPG
ncbi:hypothetical protein ACFW1F_17070 [Streptomyces bungoensis]|uniref:hypothetical protein n=1 Tax=Streptomyces bungoensis TaxID=285568 RepID=UPI00368EC62B